MNNPAAHTHTDPSTTHTPRTPARFASIGAGNMGDAIIRGSIDAGAARPADWAAADHDPEKRHALEARGIPAAGSIADLAHLAADDALVLLAIKPQQLRDTAADLARLLAGTQRSLLSILAGTPIATIRHALRNPKDWSGSVLRAMPNTPAAIRRGSIALAIPAATPERHAQDARTLLASVGRVLETDEDTIDPFTAIAGSGPAYLFAFTEALASAAANLGFDDATARRIAADTVTGAAALLEQQAGADPNGPPDPAALRAAVTSKGGTTAAALDAFELGDLNGLVDAAAKAALRRARELAEPK